MRHDSIALSLANFVGIVVGFLFVLIIRLRNLLLAASLSFEFAMLWKEKYSGLARPKFSGLRLVSEHI